jgi:hypothetical protein
MKIPEGWRVCGENMYAKHAIHYCHENGNACPHIFICLAFGMKKTFVCPWNETEEWAELLGLTLVQYYIKVLGYECYNRTQ